MSEKFDIVVTCVRCRQDFEGFNEGQADECAADVRGEVVRGHYGSAVLDMETAFFADGKDHGLPDGQICDACIEHLCAAGLLLRPTQELEEKLRSL